MTPRTPPTITRAAFLGRLAALVMAAATGRPALAFTAPLRTRRAPFPHPEPRAGITAERVLAADTLPNRKRVRAAYDAARAHPAVFDGLYCACRCDESFGHRSLLACFESDQPTGCWACQEEAAMARRMADEGRSLAEIRQAVDKEYG